MLSSFELPKFLVLLVISHFFSVFFREMSEVTGYVRAMKAIVLHSDSIGYTTKETTIGACAGRPCRAHILCQYSSSSFQQEVGKEKIGKRLRENHLGICDFKMKEAYEAQLWHVNCTCKANAELV